MFKGIHGLAPDYLANEVTMVTEVQNRTTWQFNNNNVHVPRVGIEKAKSAFSYSGPIVWNSLPDDIKECTCINVFKRKAQQYFITK